MKLVSIIVPMKNAEAFVAGTLDSLLAQTYLSIEIIIVNDGSTDKSLKIIESLKNQRIKIIDGEGKGISSALNLALNFANGEYVCRCDADDLYPSNRIEKQVKWLDSHSEYIAVAGKYSAIDLKGNFVTEFDSGDMAGDISEELLEGKTRTTLCSFLIQTHVLKSLGGFREYFVTAEDIDMQLRLGQAGAVYYLPENTYFYRIHQSSITHMQSTNQREFYENQARDFLTQRMNEGQDDLDKGKPTPPLKATHEFSISRKKILGYMIGDVWRQHDAGNKLRAIKCACRVAMKHPFQLIVWKTLLMIIIKN